MTTTSTQQGLQENQRLSSRVLKPPGGGSSDIFGVGPTYSSPSRSPASAVDNETLEKQSATPSSGNQSTNTLHNNTTETTNTSSRFQMRNRQGAFNPITGEPYAPTQASPKQDSDKTEAVGKAQPDVHTSSRVLNPPGGPSTRLW